MKLYKYLTISINLSANIKTCKLFYVLKFYIYIFSKEQNLKMLH